MTTVMPRFRFIASAALAFAATALVVPPARAQGPGGDDSPAARRAAQLDSEGKTDEARVVWQAMIDSATTAEDTAQARRAMAMSFAFDGDCDNIVKYEQMVIDYWKTQEQKDPQNAFYQEGEMADEAARTCLDAGDIDAAEHWYRMGHELGLKEPEPRTHPKALWDYRLAHALARIAARRGNVDEAKRQIAAAREALQADSAMAAQQQRFFPYLVGYVALYTDDLNTAQQELEKAIAMRGNDRDPFMHALLGMTYEKMGRAEDAKAMYQKAYDLAGGHNPPAAFARPFARKKLSEAGAN